MHTRLTISLSEAMPPKLKTAPATKKATKVEKKSASKGSIGAVTEGDSAKQENRADLLAKVQALEQVAVKANEHRNYMELERDKIDAFWEITKSDLEHVKAELRDAQRDLEMSVEQHDMELRLQEHKVKHIKHERLEAEAKIRAECEEETRRLREECRERVCLVKQGIDVAEAQSRRIIREHEDQIRKLKLEHSAKLCAARERCQQSASNRIKELERETLLTIDSFESSLSEQLTETEARYASYMNELVEVHTTAFGELKEYFNNLTDTNEREIDRLKTKLEETTIILRKQSTELSEVRKENESLKAPLADANNKVHELQKRLFKYERQLERFQKNEKCLRNAEAKLKASLWENEELIQKLEKVEGDLEHMRREALFMQCSSLKVGAMKV